MAGKTRTSSLPPLRKVFPRFRGFPERGHLRDLVTAHLLKAARQLRKRHNQSFYSMRETAQFFSVQLSTMALVYRRLEDEGLIVRMRGSHTVLLGKQLRSHHPVHSIVSVPIRHVVGITSLFASTFFYRISKELWRKHFMAHPVFCTQTEFENPELARQLARQSDVVIWIFPGVRARESLEILHDHGVQNVTLIPDEDLFFPPTYIMSFAEAYRTALATWVEEGIEAVIVPRAIHPVPGKIVTQRFAQLAREAGLEVIPSEPDASGMLTAAEPWLKRRRRVACAVLETMLMDHMGRRDAPAAIKLLQRCRVLFGRGIIRSPLFFDRDLIADVISFEGNEVALRIARDLGKPSSHTAPVTLYPHWMPQRRLSQLFP